VATPAIAFGGLEYVVVAFLGHHAPLHSCHMISLPYNQ
jgi:hypothetical protein